ncbi:hypothetical protein AAF712_003581 [Marasmius tenuissimus]|uniref:Ketoreductase domain-containing protein n=1 Tax=Marasmius tenuissimus TaxID=585030 RepID=A0ABR3A6K3_9AGAR
MSLNLFSLKGKNALVTGGSRGIGRAAAIALAEAGANICLVLRPSSTDGACSDSTEQVIREKTGVRVAVVRCDLDDHSDNGVKSVVPRALELMDGEIHILVNCAGIQRRTPAVNFSEKDWDDVVGVNLKTVWLLSQAAGQHMVPLKRGKIINFASLLSFQGGLTVPAYAAAKGGVATLTKALSNEWSKEVRDPDAGGGSCLDGSILQSGCPYLIPVDYSSNYPFVRKIRNVLASLDTHLGHFLPRPYCLRHSYSYELAGRNEALLNNPTRLAQLNDRIPAGRWGTPEDFAGPLVFLASDASNYVCGELLLVDGVSVLAPQLAPTLTLLHRDGWPGESD